MGVDLERLILGYGKVMILEFASDLSKMAAWKILISRTIEDSGSFQRSTEMTRLEVVTILKLQATWWSSIWEPISPITFGVPALGHDFCVRIWYLGERWGLFSSPGRSEQKKACAVAYISLGQNSGPQRLPLCLIFCESVFPFGSPFPFESPIIKTIRDSRITACLSGSTQMSLPGLCTPRKLMCSLLH